MVDNICGDLDFEDGGNPAEMNRVLAAVDPVLMGCLRLVTYMMYYQPEEVPLHHKRWAATLRWLRRHPPGRNPRLDGNSGAPPKSRKVVELLTL